MFFFFLLILQFYLKSCLIYGKFEILGKPNLIFFKLYGTSIIAVISDCIFILMRFFILNFFSFFILSLSGFAIKLH